MKSLFRPEWNVGQIFEGLWSLLWPSEGLYELYYDAMTIILFVTVVAPVVVEFKAKVSESETFSCRR